MAETKPKYEMRRIAAAAVIAAAAAFGVSGLLVNIFERKQEARNPFFRVVELTEDTEDPAAWGKNFPHQYDSWKRTVDMTRTRYGGSEALSHSPTQVDPRSAISQSKLQEDPRLKTMWAGYAFGVDFREERGHAYMLIDQRYTRRVTEFKQPGTCLNCHASTYVAMRKLGGGDIFKGFEQINQMTYAEATRLVEHPVACVDCHDPVSLRLRITRPAFLEGIRNLKASQGVADYDPNTMASAEEMRSYVCGQCHVEYYFKGAEKRLTFPWHKGLQVEKMYEYYTEVKQTDWVHKDTGGSMLEAQHPEFEMFNQGVHARSGVACADCHIRERRAHHGGHLLQRFPVPDVGHPGAAQDRVAGEEPADRAGAAAVAGVLDPAACEKLDLLRHRADPSPAAASPRPGYTDSAPSGRKRQGPPGEWLTGRRA